MKPRTTTIPEPIPPTIIKPGSQKCISCYYCQADSRNLRCHFWPPEIRHPNMDLSSHPVVSPMGWCGQYKENPYYKPMANGEAARAVV